VKINPAGLNHSVHLALMMLLSRHEIPASVWIDNPREDFIDVLESISATSRSSLDDAEPLGAE
jgi:hypothetical protein